MDFSLRDKIAVITGAGRGLGQAMTLALAAAGADIVGVDVLPQDETAAAVRALGRRFTPVFGDFSEPGRLDEAAAAVLSAFGRVDILVNNAGITPVVPAEDTTEADFDRVMAVNVKSLYFFTQKIGRHMIENGFGRIINVCSVQSLKGGMDVSAYIATKHAVAGITRALANEWARFGLRVNGIAPGFMVTQNTAGLRAKPDAVAALTAQIPMGRWGQPEDLQGPVVFLASEASAYVNGHLLVVDGGHMNN